MKKVFTLIVFTLIALSAYGQTNKLVTLDEAIRNSVIKIQEELNEGSRIIVYQFQSQNSRISDYILNQLFVQLKNTKKFTVLDRETAIQEAINKEINFQYKENAGIISDESLASLTKGIGAQAIVTGSLVDTLLEYSFMIKVLGIETKGETLVANIENVTKNDKRIAAFTKVPKQKTSGDKFGTGALNVILGLGSYIEGDIGGGVTVTAGYAIAAGLVVLEITALDWDSPMVGVPITAGVAVAGVTLVYGFIRPFVYNRSPRVAYMLDNAQIGIVPASDNVNGDLGFRLSYTIKY